MNVVFDGARKVVVDDEGDLHVGEGAAEDVVDDQTAFERRTGTRGTLVRGTELGEDVVATRLAHVLDECEGFDAARPELVRDRLHGFDAGTEDDGMFERVVLEHVGERLQLPLARSVGFAATNADRFTLRRRVADRDVTVGKEPSGRIRLQSFASQPTGSTASNL